jgi:hypothetical protein
MGYRSHVVLAISKHLTPFFMMKLSQNKEAEELVFKHADEFDRDYQGDKSWLIRFDSIKWYDSYDDIITLENFIQEASSDEYEFEIEGVEQSSCEHIKFVRVGEESTDIESSGDGFWDIYPHTSISY